LTEDSPRPAPPKRDVIDVGLRERTKQALDLGKREADPAVGDRKGYADLALGAAHRRDLQRNAARFRELHGIVDQVFQRRAQANGVADHQRRKLVRYLDLPLQPFRRRPAGKRIAGVAGERPQVEQILAQAGRSGSVLGRIDEQGRKARQVLGAGLDGVDPAPLALIEIRGREQIADGEDSGQRRAHLVGECGERRFDHPGRRLLGTLAPCPCGRLGDARLRRPPILELLAALEARHYSHDSP